MLVKHDLANKFQLTGNTTSRGQKICRKKTPNMLVNENVVCDVMQHEKHSTKMFIGEQ